MYDLEVMDFEVPWLLENYHIDNLFPLSKDVFVGYAAVDDVQVELEDVMAF